MHGVPALYLQKGEMDDVLRGCKRTEGLFFRYAEFLHGNAEDVENFKGE